LRRDAATQYFVGIVNDINVGRLSTDGDLDATRPCPLKTISSLECCDGITATMNWRRIIGLRPTVTNLWVPVRKKIVRFEEMPITKWLDQVQHKDLTKNK